LNMNSATWTMQGKRVASGSLALTERSPCQTQSTHVSKRASSRFHIGHHQPDGTRRQCSLSMPHLALSTRTMSQTHHNASSSSSSSGSSSSNFQSVPSASLDAYEKKTKSKLLTHPLAARLQSCDSSTAILSILQDLIQQFDHRRRSDERLTNWLNPTVNVLYAFSSTLGQGLGLVSLNRLSS
jgi:hypothetical protein